MTRDEKLALVGDYVLGVLDDNERRAFEAEAVNDPELSQMTHVLSLRLSALDDTAAPENYNADLLSRINQSIDALPREQGENLVPLVARRAPAPPLARWLPIAASVLVALGLGYLTGTLSRPDSQPTVIAVMLDQTDATPAIIVEAFADNTIRLVPLENFVAPEGQVLQVWTLPDATTGPTSLGTLASTRDIRLTGPDLPVPHAGQLYEITLEPAPGSPIGRPTGPILVKGFAKAPLS